MAYINTMQKENNMKKLSLIGIGKLGLCFALTLEKSGYDVLGCDIDESYINAINAKTFKSDEEGVESALQEAINFEATLELKRCVEHSDILFLLVATPSLPNGKYDHSQIESVVDQLLTFELYSEHKHLVICCTTMPEYCDTVQGTSRRSQLYSKL